MRGQCEDKQEVERECQGVCRACEVGGGRCEGQEG